MIVDTNVIVYCTTRKIDLLAAIRAMHEHYQPVLLDCILEEIRRIRISETERNIALKSAERFDVQSSSGFGDDFNAIFLSVSDILIRLISSRVQSSNTG